MKLTGSNKSGQHTIKAKHKAPGNKLILNGGKKTPNTMRKKLLKIGSTVFGILVVLTVVAFIYIKVAVKPPPITDNRNNPGIVNAAGPNETDNPIESDVTPSMPGNDETSSRKDLIYTFLLFALDADSYNTDVIMVMNFNTTTHKIEVVNLPRDTLANVSWNLKKANSIYANMMVRNSGKENAQELAMQATVEMFSDIIGFEVDYWFIVNMNAFKALVDAVNGIDFDVPVNMNYHDNAAGLHIVYSKGIQHLNGQQALEVMRFRTGYSNADIGRINTQQSFLMTAASQILAKKDSINITEMADIFFKYVKIDSDLTLGSLIWFGKEFLKMEPDGIGFHTMPGDYNDYVGYDSYVSIYIDEWLELLNEYINPYVEDITLESLSILTRGADGRLYATDGNRAGNASWGSGSVNRASQTTTSSNTAGSSSGNGTSSNNSNSSGGNAANNSSTNSGSGSQTNPANASSGNQDGVTDNQNGAGTGAENETGAGHEDGEPTISGNSSNEALDGTGTNPDSTAAENITQGNPSGVEGGTGTLETPASQPSEGEHVISDGEVAAAALPPDIQP